MIINKPLIKRTYWMNKHDLSDVAIVAEQMSVSASDVIRLAIKEYVKKHKLP